jgi:hypothetical protein
VFAALKAGDYEEVPGGGVRAAGEDLAPDEVLRGERVALEGWAIAQDGTVSVALDVELDDDLLLEGRAFDLIHRVNDLRKETGLALTDRVRLTLPASDEDLLRHADRIRDEVLAVSVETDDAVDEPRIVKI